MKQHLKPSHKISSAKSDGFRRHALNKMPSSRPASAKDIFESNNHKKNEEAWKHEEMLANVNSMKKREWQAQVYTSLALKKRDETNIDWKEQRERERKLNERREKLRKLFTEEAKIFEKEREGKLKSVKSVPSDLSDPEIQLLRTRLNDLKRQNEEERRKLSEKLSYECWKNNNHELRQVESDRFNKFIRDSWADQKQWREDERISKEEETRRSEGEAEERRRSEEEEERKRGDRIQQDRLKWKKLLEEQIQELKEQEKEEEIMSRKEIALEKEKIRLQEIVRKREKISEERKRKNLELFWARQSKLKLKQKSIFVQEELFKDEIILEDLLRGAGKESTADVQNELQQEGEWMKSIFAEQKELEKLRENEYDLLFSEEAEKMWLKREAEWQREQQARDKLFKGVLKGLQNQIEENLLSTRGEMEAKHAAKENLILNIEDNQKKIEKKEEKLTLQNGIEKSSVPNISCLSERDIRRQELLMDRSIEERQAEISKLEEEMRKIWLGSYVLPKFGRKKVDY